MHVVVYDLCSIEHAGAYSASSWPMPELPLLEVNTTPQPDSTPTTHVIPRSTADHPSRVINLDRLISIVQSALAAGRMITVHTTDWRKTSR